MSVLMVQSKIKAETVADVQAGIKTVLAALDVAQSERIRWVSSVLPDGETLSRCCRSMTVWKIHSQLSRSTRRSWTSSRAHMPYPPAFNR